jgi:hypothetical protein
MAEEANAYPVLPTIFGTTDIPTYEELKRRRAIAAALAGQKRGFPKTLGEGLTYFGEALGEAGLEWRLRQEEARSQGYVRDQVGGAPPVVPPPQIGGSPPPPAAARPPAAPAPARLPGSDPAVPSTLSPAPVSAAPPPAPVAAAPEPAPAPVAAAPDIGGDGDQPTIASAPDLPAPDVTSSEATRNPLSGEGPSPQALAALKAAMVQQQAEARPPVQPVQPEQQGNVREAITNALMMSPQREADRPQPPMQSMPPTEAALAPPQGGPGGPGAPLTDAPLKITVGGPQNMKDRSLGAYLKPTTVPRGIENLDPKVQQYARDVSAAFPGVKFTSGYRSPAVNAAVGGAPNSEHMRRIALDMDVSDVPADQRRALIADARMRGAGGLGNYGGNSIHVDFRTGQPVAWGPNRSYTSLGQTPEWFRSEAAPHRMGERPQAVAQAAPPASPPPAGPPVNTLAVRPSPMMQEQPPQVAQAGGDQQDAVLQDVLGAGQRPGLRGATASLGRAGVANDAGPDSPLGAGIAASVDARRNAITGSLNGQPAPAPTDPAMQVAQAAGGSTVDSGTIFNPRPVKTIPIQGPQPGSDIQKAPATLPSDEPIPGQPPRMGEVKPFQAEPMTARERWLRDKAADPRMPDNYKALFAKEAAELEQDRRKLEDRKWDLHKQDLERYYKEPEKELAARLQRAQIEEQNAKARMRPDEIAKATADRQIAEQNLAKLQRENDPRYVEADWRKKQLEIQEAEQRLRKGEQKEHTTIAGMLYERQPDGSWKNATPTPELGDIKLTEKEMTTLKYFERARQASHRHGDFSALAGFKDTALGKVPIGGNYAVSNDYQIQNSEANAWVESTQRDVSGAVVGPVEYANAKKNYFPEPGDGPDLIAIKKQRREVAERSLYDSLGPGQRIADKFVGEQKAQSSAAEEAGALKWLRENPGDPRAPAVKKKLGIP